MRALILAGGKLVISKQIIELAKSAELIIAADSGLKYAQQLNISPEIIIGDFDSVQKTILDKYPNIQKLSYPKKKDKLDLELAIDYAIKQNAREIIVLAATGGRLDQTMAAILIAARVSKKTKISLHSGVQDVFFANGPKNISLNLEKGQTFSLLSLGLGSSLSLMGAEYNLNTYQLDFGTGVGVSNIATNPPIEIDLHSGQIVVIVEYDI